MNTEKPMMMQYRQIKDMHKDCILMFRLGGFYEMFFKDAYIASKILGLKVSVRNSGNGVVVPQCGIPAKAADKYAKILVERGYTVAICNQVEGESETEGVKNRAVTEIIRPDEDTPAASPVSEKEYTVFLAEFEAEVSMRAKKKKHTEQTDTAFTIMKELESLDLANTTPTAAWALLYHLKRTYCDIND